MIDELASLVAEKCVVEQYPDGDVEIITIDVRKMAKPVSIQNLMGRSFLFKLSVEQKHITGKDDVYHVKKVSEDDGLKTKYLKTAHLFCAVAPPRPVSVVDTDSTPIDNVPDDDCFFSPQPVRPAKRYYSSQDGGSTMSKGRLIVFADDDPVIVNGVNVMDQFTEDGHASDVDDADVVLA